MIKGFQFLKFARHAAPKNVALCVCHRSTMCFQARCRGPADGAEHTAVVMVSFEEEDSSQVPILAESQTVFVFAADGNGMGNCIREQEDIYTVERLFLNHSTFYAPIY